MMNHDMRQVRQTSASKVFLYAQVFLAFFALMTKEGRAQLIYPSPLGDDRFDSAPCCANVTPSLPQVRMPVYLGTQRGHYAILGDCGLKQSHWVDFTVDLFPHPGGDPASGTPPVDGLPACDEFVVRIGVSASTVSTFGGGGLTTIGPAPGAPNRVGFALAKYVRTWTGLGPTGDTQYQYWRYMLEGDAMSWASSVIPTNNFPACWAAVANPGTQYTGVAFRGYLDLMRPVYEDEPFIDPMTGGQVFTLVLSHYDGCIEHIDIPSLNPRSIAGSPPSKHVGVSYHFVSPSGFTWAVNPPARARLDLANAPHDSLRSTVSHTKRTHPVFGQSPGPLCLAEMPLTANAETEDPVCNCASSVAGIDFNQVFASPQNFGTCATQHFWQSQSTVPEIPTGFVQTYLGQWNSSSKPHVAFVQLTSVTGTIEYNDHCAHSREYFTDSLQIVWGNANLWPNATVPNAPTIMQNGDPHLTDYVLHFGNHVDAQDNLIIAHPAYVNVIWNIFR